MDPLTAFALGVLTASIVWALVILVEEGADN